MIEYLYNFTFTSSERVYLIDALKCFYDNSKEGMSESVKSQVDAIYCELISVTAYTAIQLPDESLNIEGWDLI